MNDGVHVDPSYTYADHRFRYADPYARGKYDIALRWLAGTTGPGHLLYNVGCGVGDFNARLAEDGARVVALEPDPDAYRLAAEAAGPSVTVLNCGIEAFGKDREPGDAVVIMDVLEHIEDDRAAAALIARLLRPDGRMILSVPALSWLFGLHDELLGHYRRYSGAQLRAVLEPHFVIERFQYYGMLSIPLVLWFSRLRRRPYPVETGISGVVGRIYSAVCATESHIPEPIGSSIVLLARPR